MSVRCSFFVVVIILIILIKNAFWDIENSDVHEAVSFDRLHAYIIGLWKQHLFGELKSIIEDLGRSVEVEFEDLYVVCFSSSMRNIDLKA